MPAQCAGDCHLVRINVIDVARAFARDARDNRQIASAQQQAEQRGIRRSGRPTELKSAMQRCGSSQMQPSSPTNRRPARPPRKARNELLVDAACESFPHSVEHGAVSTRAARPQNGSRSRARQETA